LLVELYIYTERFTHLQLLEKVYAGKPNEIPKALIIGGVDLPISIAGGADYALKVTGISITELSTNEEGIGENDIVLVRLQKYAENGQIVIERLYEETYMIKRFRQTGRQTDYLEIVGILRVLIRKFK
jgi:SOS-response transcriptional repressor LexA